VKNKEKEMQKEIIIDCSECGVKLSTKPDPEPRWYGTYKGDKPISGVCEECYKDKGEKEEKSA